MNNNEKGLTPKQNERYNSLVHFYGNELALDLVVNHIAAKGANSWSSVQEKIELLKKSDRIQQKYEDALIEEFEINEDCTFDEIIQKVSSVRADLDLPPYSRSIKTNSINDFLNLFIVEKLYDNDSTGNKKKETGYRPTFKLKKDKF